VVLVKLVSTEGESDDLACSRGPSPLTVLTGDIGRAKGVPECTRTGPCTPCVAIPSQWAAEICQRLTTDEPRKLLNWCVLAMLAFISPGHKLTISILAIRPRQGTSMHPACLPACPRVGSRGHLTWLDNAINSLFTDAIAHLSIAPGPGDGGHYTMLSRLLWTSMHNPGRNPVVRARQL